MFVVGNNGAIAVSWVQDGGSWRGPLAIGPRSSAAPGSQLAASQQFGIPNQTDVFAAPTPGAVDVYWVQDAGSWRGPLRT